MTPEAPQSPPLEAPRHRRAVVFWIVVTLFFWVVSPLLVTMPGALLFMLGDVLPRRVLGPRILPDPSDAVFDVSLPMGFLWPLGCIAIWGLFAWHRRGASWRGAKWAGYAVSLFAWTNVLAVTLHLTKIAPANREDAPGIARPAARGIDSVRTLVAGGGDVNQFIEFRTPLMYAADAGDVELIRVLLSRGADIHATVPSEGGLAFTGNTALIIAAARGRPSAVQLLLERGARPEQKGAFGMTAHDAAKQAGHSEVVAILARSRP